MKSNYVVEWLCRVQYRLDDQAIIERVIPSRACVRYVQNGCDVSMKNHKNCARFKELHDGCINYIALKDLLAEGCDAAKK